MKTEFVLAVLLASGFSLFGMDSYTPIEKVVEHLEETGKVEEDQDAYKDTLGSLLSEVNLSDIDPITEENLLTVAVKAGNCVGIQVLAEFDRLQQEKGEEKAFDYEHTLITALKEEDNPEVVTALLEQGANVTACFPMHEAIEWKREKSFLSLLQHISARADKREILEARDSQGETPVLAAASLGRWDYLRALKDLGVRLDVSDYEGNTVAGYAEATGSVVFMSLFGLVVAADEDDARSVIDVDDSDEDI